MIIVFDLDEVLYDEKTYVISGFRTVSEFLEKDEAIPKKIIFVKEFLMIYWIILEFIAKKI